MDVLDVDREVEVELVEVVVAAGMKAIIIPASYRLTVVKAVVVVMPISVLPAG